MVNETDWQRRHRERAMALAAREWARAKRSIGVAALQLALVAPLPLIVKMNAATWSIWPLALVFPAIGLWRALRSLSRHRAEWHLAQAPRAFWKVQRAQASR